MAKKRITEKTRLKSNDLIRVEHMEKLFEYIAYGSLLIDFGIAAVTLYSANSGNVTPALLQVLLNYAVTVVLIVSAILFITIRVMVHYERVLDGFARLVLKIRK
ncbi:MAG: hypothetical protein M1504_03430 [Candidatus Marsarchaeota archaeon]|nr:hypothetical protein [Candidatus Marsarchaeota archaeon]